MDGSSMDKVAGQLNEQRIARMIVQSHRRVWRDAKANAKWVFGLLVLILLWAFVSAAISAKCGLVYSPQPTTSGPKEELEYGAALYFTFINMTTVGFGDIYPISGGARILAVVNGILGIVMFALVTGALVLSLSPSGEDDDKGNDVPEPGAGAYQREQVDERRLDQLREANVLAWHRIAELVAVVSEARDLVPSERPTEEPLSSGMESLRALLHTRETQTLLDEAMYARSYLAHAFYGIVLAPKNTSSAHPPKI